MLVGRLAHSVSSTTLAVSDRAVQCPPSLPVAVMRSAFAGCLVVSAGGAGVCGPRRLRWRGGRGSVSDAPSIRGAWGGGVIDSQAELGIDPLPHCA